MEASVKTVFFVDQFGVSEGMPREFVGVPFIIDEDGKPASHINEYLLARRNGDWASKVGEQGLAAELHGRAVLRASLNYLGNRVYQLDVFRRWLAGEGLSFAAVGDKELDRFAEDLEEGLVTGYEGGLQPSTVNQYLTSIIDFLRYAALVGWRQPPNLAMTKARAGRRESSRPLVMRRVNPSELHIWYTEAQVSEFIDEFETAPMKLAARIMYGTGLRISETLNLTISQFPSVEEHQRDPAKRRIRVTGKFGKSRWVPISGDMLSAVHRFVAFERKLYASKASQQSDLLLIGVDGDGNVAPLKARAVQRAFAKAREAAGLSAISPHLLRHHFAAHFLLQAWRAKTLFPGAPVTTADSSLATSLLSSELLALKEALGHSSFDTTLKYLHALTYLSGSQIADDYADGLEAEDEE